MTFDDFEQTFKKVDLSEEIIADYKIHHKVSLSNSDKKSVLRNMEMFAFQAKFLPTLNLFVLGLLHDKDNTFEAIKRKGLLRYSKYLDLKNLPEVLCQRLIKLAPDIGLNTSELQYIESIHNLAPVYTIMTGKKEQIVTEIKKFSKRPKMNGVAPSLIKTLLAALDFLFLTNYYPEDRGWHRCILRWD